MMKLVSWNVNGIRSLRKDLRVTITELDADIICFQETKISKEMMTEDLAIIDGYRSYYSYCKTRAGYSGVATYCSKDIQPVNAIDSLTSTLSSEEGELSFSLPPDVLKTLDCEGRSVITQHSLRLPINGKSLLTVINVYCPCVTGEKDGREIFRMQFLQTLEERVVQLQKISNVLVVGDINVAHRMIDHCEPGDEMEFSEQPHRQWLSRILNAEDGLLTDSFRALHPEKKFAYSCWNTQTGGRQTNYGTRIDYILLDRDLKECLTSAEVLAKYLGSDHCPVSVELSLSTQASSKPPELCTSHKYRAKQQKLTMFMKKSDGGKSSDIFDSMPPVDSTKTVAKKRKTTKKAIAGTLNGFVKKKKDDNACSLSPQTDLSQSSISGESEVNSQPEKDSQSQPSSQNSTSESWSKLFNKKVKELPLCSEHREKCVLRTVKKAGENKGRQFYSCSRPPGAAKDEEARCSYFLWADAM